jgi:hypothetical protein
MPRSITGVNLVAMVAGQYEGSEMFHITCEPEKMADESTLWHVRVFPADDFSTVVAWAFFCTREEADAFIALYQ